MRHVGRQGLKWGSSYQKDTNASTDIFPNCLYTLQWYEGYKDNSKNCQ